ncbi:ABC transporter substrate-binding protein [Bradyrhizobium sp. UNPF46]|uniref:branched-chain amino acid ABC transporter substrate-binding protein n=1 Tax=Bradyrhizobium sp. UNPF46 TaxID=1141168 RepID=UPI00116A178B|nr:branched-chain amino acid ABC transporter substrate-binding protein [Bradyrhizobium sp. UNPF46]TQF42565.1 ABC transporter substrate-binding protein [Bradyrhizobium sp. UNPF46]
MTRLSRRSFLTAAGVSLATPYIARAQSNAPIKVGGMLPMSGAASIEGRQVLLGLQFAVEEINAKGGLLDRKIELVIEDDESNSTKGVTAVRRLIERDQVPFIVGTYASAVVVAAVKVAAEYKVPMLSGGSTAAAATDQNSPGDPWFFRSWPDSNRQGEDTAKAIVEKFKKTKVAIIHDNTNYGVTLADQVTRVVTGVGGAIVSRDSYNAGEQDFSSMLTKVRTLRPEAVYIGGWAGDGANIVRQAAEIGLRAQFVGSGSMLSDDFIKLAGPASEGFAVATVFEPSTPNPVGRAFADRFRARFNQDANTFSSIGFDSTSIGLEAMRRVGKPDGLEIQKMIKGGMKDFALAQGPAGTTAAFNEKGSVDFPDFIAVIKDGKRRLEV